MYRHEHSSDFTAVIPYHTIPTRPGAYAETLKMLIWTSTMKRPSVTCPAPAIQAQAAVDVSSSLSLADQSLMVNFFTHGLIKRRIGGCSANSTYCAHSPYNTCSLEPTAEHRVCGNVSPFQSHHFCCVPPSIVPERFGY